MAAIFLARGSAAATINIPKSSAVFVDSTSRFSIAFQRDEGRNSAAVSEGAAAFMADTVKQGVEKAKEVADAMVGGAKKTVERRWAAAKDVNQGVRKTVVAGGSGGRDHEGEVGVGEEEGETVVDEVVEEIKDIDGPVDMAEYRAIKQSLEDLNNKVD